MPTCDKSISSWSALYCSLLHCANFANERLQILEGCIQRLLQTTALTLMPVLSFFLQVQHKTITHITIKIILLVHAHTHVKMSDFLVHIFQETKCLILKMDSWRGCQGCRRNVFSSFSYVCFSPLLTSVYYLLPCSIVLNCYLGLSLSAVPQGETGKVS